MSQRVHDTTKWFWCLLFLYYGPNWNPVRCVPIRTSPSKPYAIESQAKFFQDFFSVQLSPYKIEFGHVCEDPNTWEQRYEKKDFKNHRDMGKIRWGDKKGGYGEHYWDLNHAGHAADHGDDTGSSDSYEEPSEQSPNYDSTSYDLNNPTQHEDSSREKRTPMKTRKARVQEKEKSDETERLQVMRRQVPKQKERKKVLYNDSDVEGNENLEVHKTSAKLQERHPQKESQNIEENTATKQRNQVVLIVNEKDKGEQPVRYMQRNPEAKVFVPYEGGAGVRQHYQAEITPAASVPRLFLDPSTGHVVDRATGQAYVLQPINLNS